jgi:hypothetical protein
MTSLRGAALPRPWSPRVLQILGLRCTSTLPLSLERVLLCIILSPCTTYPLPFPAAGQEQRAGVCGRVHELQQAGGNYLHGLCRLVPDQVQHACPWGHVRHHRLPGCQQLPTGTRPAAGCASLPVCQLCWLLLVAVLVCVARRDSTVLLGHAGTWHQLVLLASILFSCLGSEPVCNTLLLPRLAHQQVASTRLFCPFLLTPFSHAHHCFVSCRSAHPLRSSRWRLP